MDSARVAVEEEEEAQPGGAAQGRENRGEFVEGDGPLQYAEPGTVEELRAMREARDEAEPEEGLAAVAGSDPVLLGLDAPRDGWCVLRRGEAVVTLSGGGDLVVGKDAADRAVKAAVRELQGLLRRGRDPLGRPRRLVVAAVAGREAAGSPFSTLLEGLGFTRDGPAYSWRAL